MRGCQKSVIQAGFTNINARDNKMKYLIAVIASGMAIAVLSKAISSMIASIAFEVAGVR